MRLLGDFGEGIRRKKLQLKQFLLQIKWFFDCIFGFSTLENPWDALIVQKLAIKLVIPVIYCRILTGKTTENAFKKSR